MYRVLPRIVACCASPLPRHQLQECNIFLQLGVHLIPDSHNVYAAMLTQVGITPETQEALTAPLKASSQNLLAGLDAVRSAYEKTLTR